MNKVFKLLLSAVLMLCCFAASAAGTQPSTGNGSQTNPYQIATSDNLVWFAEHVNSGNASACAILTADITVNAGVLDSNGDLNGTPSNTWTPIGGQNGRDYSGEFDGNGHTISGLYFNDESVNNIGLFGKTANNAHIHDLGISDSYFCGKDHVGGICGDFASGRIENCWSEVAVYVATGDGGGLTGSVYINAVLTNCYSICNVSGNGSRGLVCGAFYGTIENCYAQNRNSTGTTSLIGWTSGEGPHTATNVEIKDAAAFASGEVCWLLNNGVTDGTQKWYQTLGGTDNFPVLDNSHGTVYYGYDGNVLTYSNSPLAPPTIDNVAYIDADGVEQTADNVSIIMNASEQVTWSAGWYVVQGTDIILAKGAVCNGEVHLILADGAKLTATGDNNSFTPGIMVSGTGNSLAIYGQTAQSGQLTATGGNNAAGIGGGNRGSGSYITINGGVVTATGGIGAAGIGGGNDGAGLHITINGGIVTATGGDMGAGIGGGWASTVYYSGNYITITGGEVTATGGGMGAGIGGGFGGSCSNISIIGGKVTATGGMGVSGIGAGKNGTNSYSVKIATTLLVKADNNNPPTTVIPNTGFNLADSLKDKQYVTTEPIIITYGEHITVSPEFASGANVAYGTDITFTAADRWDDCYEFLGFYKESTFDTPITEGVSGRTCTLTVTEAAMSVYAKYEQFTPTHYIDAGGQEQVAKAIEITSTTLSAGWYVVRGSNENHGALTCNGAVHLILADGAKLTAQGGEYQAGITVSGEGNSLTIYGQTAQSGQLIANGGNYAAAIGGGSGDSGSNITINGGIVIANGGYAGAGIGGGKSGSASNITITGGSVTANGGEDASCIGRGFLWQGNYGSNIKVATELIVRADGNNPPVTVVAADRTAETDIAGDLDGKRYATVRIPQGGIVTYGEYITVSPQFASGDRVAAETEVTFTAADRWAENYEFLGFYKESTFDTPITAGVSGQTYTITATEADISVYAKYKEFTPTPYIDADGQEQTANAAEITNETSTLDAGWYVVTGEVSRGNITCHGAVHLILADGAKLTATEKFDKAGITVSGDGKSLTIYGQTAQSGQLIANGGEFGAGIGGGDGGSGSNITINGGKVVATGGNHAAGIGGGYHNSGSNITINGGIVIANGGYDGAGIGGGGGDRGSGSNITINGGKVVATGGDNAAGIGGGTHGSGSNITINGGEVTATGGISHFSGVPTGSSFGRGNLCDDFCINITVATALTVYAGDSNPPTTEIVHVTGQDIAGLFDGKQYAIVKDETTDVKVEAIAAINAAIEGVTNEEIIAFATNAIDAINAATSVETVNAIKEQALAAIAALKSAYASALGEMGEPCEDCPSVEVTKGTKTVKLYNPESVKFKKE